MSAADLQNFLLKEQMEDTSQSDALQLIEKYEIDENGNCCIWPSVSVHYSAKSAFISEKSRE